jgi:hypothetical protein
MSSALDQILKSGSVGNSSGWQGGNSFVKPVTDQSDHVDGGTRGSNGTNASASAHATSVVYIMGAIVVGSLAALWLLGAFGLKSAVK